MQPESGIAGIQFQSVYSNWQMVLNKPFHLCVVPWFLLLRFIHLNLILWQECTCMHITFTNLPLFYTCDFVKIICIDIIEPDLFFTWLYIISTYRTYTQQSTEKYISTEYYLHHTCTSLLISVYSTGCCSVTLIGVPVKENWGGGADTFLPDAS